MGERGAAACDEQVFDLCGHKHPVRDVVAVAAVFQRAVPAFGMVQVDGIAGYGNGVVEAAAGQDFPTVTRLSRIPMNGATRSIHAFSNPGTN